MTKADLVEIVHNTVGLSKKESVDLVEQLFGIMQETLSKGQNIKLSGFGNFEVRDKRARMGRNLRTGEPIEITERRVLKFKPSPVLKSAINSDQTGAPPSQA